MPEFKAGRAYIEVAPSLKGFRRSTEADLNKELAGAGEKAGHQLGENIGKSAEQAVRGSGRRSADAFAGEFDKQVRTRIKAALNALPEAKIGASTNEAEQKIKDLRAELLELSDKKIGIDVDAAEATATIDRIRQEMAAIDGSTLNIDARVDTAAAIAELDRLKATTNKVDGTNVQIKADADTAAAQAKLERLQATGGGKVTVNVDADTGQASAALVALQALAAETALSISSIGLAAGVLGPALIPLAAGGVGVIAGLGGAAVGAAGGVGVLGAALAPVVGAVQAMNQASDGSPASLKKLQDAMKNLTPAGATFARYIFGLKDGLIDLSKIAQDGFLPGLQDGLQSMSGYAGLLKDTLGKLSSVLGNLARDAGKALSGPFWDGFLRFLAAKAPGWLDTLGRTLGAAATGLAGLFQALSPVVDLVGDATLNALERFADWAKNLGTNTGFQQFLAYVKENGPKAAAFIGAFAGAVSAVVGALAPFGTGVLDALTKGLNWLAQQDPARIRDVATATLVFAGALKGAAIAQGLLNIALRANPIGALLFALAAGAAALAVFYNNNAEFRDKVNAIWKSITDAFNRVVLFIQQFWAEHGAMLSAQWSIIWGQIQVTVSSVLKSIQDIVISVAGWIQNFWKEWGGRITAIFKQIWENAKQIFSGALAIIRGIFEVFAGLFTGDWGRVWNGLKGIFSGAWTVLTGTIKQALTVLKTLLSLAWSAISSVAGKAWNGIVDAIGLVFNGLKDAIRGPIYRVLQFLQENLIDKINGLFSLLKLDFRIDPIWTANGQAVAFSKGAGSSASADRGFHDGGYTGGGHHRAVAGVVHGREFVMDAATTAKAGGARAMESLRGAIRGGWKPPGYLAGGYVWPVNRRPSFPWGRYPSGGIHRAYDIATPIGTPIHNPYAGTVIRDGWDSTGYGNHVRLQHDNGRGFSILGHMTREIVNVGQRIAQNAIVGFSGSTGRSSGPHVHWATRRSPYSDASAFDPMKTFGVDAGAGGGVSVFDTVRNSLANVITGGIDGFVSLATGGLGKLGFFGQLLAGAVSKIGTGAANIGVRLLGLDSGGANTAAEHEPVKPLLFDSGGYLPTGLSLVSNRTGAPEPLRRVDRESGMGGATEVKIYGNVGYDPKEFVTLMDTRKRDAMAMAGLVSASA